MSEARIVKPSAMLRECVIMSAGSDDRRWTVRSYNKAGEPIYMIGDPIAPWTASIKLVHPLSKEAAERLKLTLDAWPEYKKDKHELVPIPGLEHRTIQLDDTYSMFP